MRLLRKTKAAESGTELLAELMKLTGQLTFGARRVSEKSRNLADGLRDQTDAENVLFAAVDGLVLSSEKNNSYIAIATTAIMEVDDRIKKINQLIRTALVSGYPAELIEQEFSEVTREMNKVIQSLDQLTGSLVEQEHGTGRIVQAARRISAQSFVSTEKADENAGAAAQLAELACSLEQKTGEML